MKRTAIFSIGLAAFVAFGGAEALRNKSAFVINAGSRPAAEIADAARAFLATLPSELAGKVKFKIEDAERLQWNFLPGRYPGLLISEMNAAQRAAAHTLLRSALSSQGYLKVTSIFSLDRILREISEKAGAPAEFRDPERYSFAIFGEPGAAAAWSFRVQGHHVSLQFSLLDGEVAGFTPMFLGANPHVVRDGQSAGLSVLGLEEEMARKLIKSLDAEQRTVALIDSNAPVDILQMPGRAAGFAGRPAGIPAARLSAAQRELFQLLIELYINNLRPEFAESERRALAAAALENVYFAWAGGFERGQGHYYRIQTPAFVIEYDNTQDGASHAHTVWRDLTRDFGGDPLAQHIRSAHGPRETRPAGK